MTVSLHPTSTAATDDEQFDALSAPVRDPGWLLARQWQTGAFIAADTGTPVHVALSHVVGPMTLSGSVLQGPVEPIVEAERLPAMDALDTAARVRLASELIRRLREAGISPDKLVPLSATWASTFPLTPVQPGSPLAPYTGRLLDPNGLYQRLTGTLSADGTGGSFPSLPGVEGSDPATAAAVESAVRGWYAWVVPQVAAPGAPPGIDPATWDQQRVEYTFTLNAAIPGGMVSLPAPGYDGMGVDWYTVDRGVVTDGLDTTTGSSVEVHPVPVSYPGMPRPRFWEFEDGDVNLDALRASSDPAHAVLATFAHEYTNDWFLVPLELPPGACLITELQVTDTFGTATRVPAVASVDADSGPWRLWEIRSATGQSDAATGLRLFFPPSPPALDGPVVEDILVARDEMANLAWIIELVTRDGDGSTIDRYQRWLHLRPPSDPTFHPSTATTASGSPTSGTYRLGTTVPDFWYPLMTVTANDKRLLALGALPPEATGVPDDGVQGQLIAHKPDTTLAEEEASREGARLTRRDRLTLGPGGIIVWRARTRGPGQGESSSGLRFDTVEPTSRTN